MFFFFSAVVWNSLKVNNVILLPQAKAKEWHNLNTQPLYCVVACFAYRSFIYLFVRTQPLTCLLLPEKGEIRLCINIQLINCLHCFYLIPIIFHCQQSE